MKKTARRRRVTVKRRADQKTEQAFTLIELLIVIAVLGLLMTLATLAWKEAKVRAYDAQALICARNIKTAEAIHYNDTQRYAVYDALGGNDVSACLVVYKDQGAPTGNVVMNHSLNVREILAQLPASLIPALKQSGNFVQAPFMAGAIRAPQPGDPGYIDPNPPPNPPANPPAASAANTDPTVRPAGNADQYGYAYLVRHASGRTTYLVSEQYLGPKDGAPADDLTFATSGAATADGGSGSGGSGSGPDLSTPAGCIAAGGIPNSVDFGMASLPQCELPTDCPNLPTYTDTAGNTHGATFLVGTGCSYATSQPTLTVNPPAEAVNVTVAEQYGSQGNLSYDGPNTGPVSSQLHPSASGAQVRLTFTAPAGCTYNVNVSGGLQGVTRPLSNATMSENNAGIYDVYVGYNMAFRKATGLNDMTVGFTGSCP